MERDIFFRAEGISAGYGGKEILHGVTFSLQPHTLTGLLGANGSGKTTLLRSISGQLEHDGNCYLNGERLEDQTVRQLARKISYIPQKSGLTISLPVLDVVLMGVNPVLKLLERPSKKQKMFAKEALRAVGLQGYEGEDYLTLSEGQKQLVFLARTLIEDTSLLLLDEPDSALDFQNRYLILKQLRQMILLGEKAGLLCLHDPALALQFCRQLILIKDGKCIRILQPDNDAIEDMEMALQQIYGNVSLVRCMDKRGKRHLTLLWEEEE